MKTLKAGTVLINYKIKKYVWSIIKMTRVMHSQKDI